jgi:ATP-dependent exoDNAse (exonuclease V) alpha subunit
MADMLRQACADQDWRIIFVGDPAQWNPIGEATSAVWSMAPVEHRAMLKEVKRFDNELLALSTAIRDKLKNKDYHLRIRNSNSSGNGIFVCSKYEFTQKIKALRLEDWSQAKVTAWRNSTVDEYNRIIRKSLGFTKEFEPNDLVLMGAPLVSDGAILAHTDEELKIISVESRVFNFPEGQLDSYVIAVFDRPYTLFVPKDPGLLESMLSKRAALASSLIGAARSKAWSTFWDLKNTFQSLRYGYAMTTHRMQGSTVDHIFVDQQDILANPNKRESFRGLYVAATRPRLTLTTY